ncbi:MAG: hypothetical protein GQ578_08060 [Desulfuromonadaceae bacterium]|nr:hypothetical protein [Desulfuromonadaceae bacterium]
MIDDSKYLKSGSRMKKVEAKINSELIDLLYRMARHMLNPDDIELHKWALKGAYLLGKLEKHDPERYAEETKPSDGAV